MQDRDQVPNYSYGSSTTMHADYDKAKWNACTFYHLNIKVICFPCLLE